MTDSPSITSTVSADAILRVPCGAPAPLVANGGAFVGCSLTKDHDGPHRIEITWER